MDLRLGVYLHVPFCIRRCTYCDFATVAGRDDLVAPYLDALVREMRNFGAARPGAIAETVFLGGGTPSRLEPGAVATLLGVLDEVSPRAPGAEVTLEANPESLDAGRVEAWRRAGVTRVSVGVQTFDDDLLRLLGRPHDAAAARRAAGAAKAAGADVSLDLIFGLPGQSLAGFEADLDEALSLRPDHLSLYALETDHDTPLARDLAAGRLAAPSGDLVGRELRRARRRLTGAGFRHYEISNYARPGHESRHNLKYWSDEPFVGFGLSAASYLDGERRANARSMGGYLADVGRGVAGGRLVEGFDPERRLGEALFTGLRRLEGVSLRGLARRYGEDRVGRHRPAIARLTARRLLRARGARIALTARALPIANEVFAEFV